MATKKPRLSLTKTQAQAGVGAELLALCQSITEDGKLQKEEIKALRDWLGINQNSDFPSIGFLCETVGRIIADRIVTSEERKELYSAIESILPPEARQAATIKRKAIEAVAKSKVRKAKNQIKETEKAKRKAEREQRERNRPLWTSNFLVCGVHMRENAQIIEEHVNEGPVYLVREPRNRHSKNAISIKTQNGLHFGYVPEHEAAWAAPLMDDGHRYSAFVVKILDGRQFLCPVIEAAIYRPDADPEYMWGPNVFSW